MSCGPCARGHGHGVLSRHEAGLTLFACFIVTGIVWWWGRASPAQREPARCGAAASVAGVRAVSGR